MKGLSSLRNWSSMMAPPSLARSFPLLVGLGLVLAWARPVQAIDLIPTDVIPPPPGLSAVMLGYNTSHRGNFYREGERLDIGARLDIDQILLRLGHAFDWDGRPSYFYAQLSNVHIHPGGALGVVDDQTGFGDLTLALATWPYVDREAGRYAGMAAYLSLPTGSYDPLHTVGLNTNAGGNRFLGALQAGYGQRLVKDLEWMLAADVVMFGDNDEYLGSQPEMGTLQQQPLFNAQTALTYRFHPAFSMSLNYFYNAGGASRTDLTPWTGDIRVQRYSLLGTVNFPIGRMTLEYGGDLQTENGFFEDQRWSLRFTYFF